MAQWEACLTIGIQKKRTGLPQIPYAFAKIVLNLLKISRKLIFIQRMEMR